MTSFADDIAGALAELRGLAESLMLDACTVTRPGAAVTDPTTGAVTNPQTTLYTGPCKVQTHSHASESDPLAGGHSFTVQRYTLHVPVGSFSPAVSDVATITATSQDPYLVGRKFTVVAILHKSLATAYRLAVTEQVA